MKVLVVVADSVRRDAVDLRPFGGTTWTNAWCAGSYTIPSLAAMVTGALPHRIGVANWVHRPAPAVAARSMFVRLAAAGLPVDVLAPNPASCFAGWPGVRSVGDSLDADTVLRTLARPGPGVVLLHHWWTHLPYVGRPGLSWSGLREATETLLTALQRDPAATAPRLRRFYAQAIDRLVSTELPRWLDAVGDAWVLVTADHGESWGELAPHPVRHIFDLHGRWMEDATTAVPLQLFHTRESVAPRVLDHPVSTLAVADTVCALVGAPTLGPTAFDGPMRILTVGSHNCEVPDRYPAQGADLWCHWSERGPEGRQNWAAADLPPDLSTEHAAAVDSGEMPADWLAERDRAEARHAAVFGRLRRLGYLD